MLNLSTHRCYRCTAGTYILRCTGTLCRA